MKRKDEQIQKLREQMMHQKEKDCKEVQELQEKLQQDQSRTLTKIHELTLKSQGGAAGFEKGKLERMSKEQLIRNIDDKDKTIKEYK